jgi:hypothetical protein
MTSVADLLQVIASEHMARADTFEAFVFSQSQKSDLRDATSATLILWKEFSLIGLGGRVLPDPWP